MGGCHHSCLICTLSLSNFPSTRTMSDRTVDLTVMANALSNGSPQPYVIDDDVMPVYPDVITQDDESMVFDVESGGTAVMGDDILGKTKCPICRTHKAPVDDEYVKEGDEIFPTIPCMAEPSCKVLLHPGCYKKNVDFRSSNNQVLKCCGCNLPEAGQPQQPPAEDLIHYNSESTETDAVEEEDDEDYEDSQHAQDVRDSFIECRFLEAPSEINRIRLMHRISPNDMHLVNDDTLLACHCCEDYASPPDKFCSQCFRLQHSYCNSGPYVGCNQCNQDGRDSEDDILFMDDEPDNDGDSQNLKLYTVLQLKWVLEEFGLEGGVSSPSLYGGYMDRQYPVLEYRRRAALATTTLLQGINVPQPPVVSGPVRSAASRRRARAQGMLN